MLILAATPIGNLGDASKRLAEAFATADLIVAEDTRVTKKLLAKLEIQHHARFVVANEHSEDDVIEQALKTSLSADVLFVSDAGMPGISDPGYALVKAAREANVPLSIIPGPSSGISALAVSGLPTDRFVHEGFIPRKGRTGYFQSLAHEPRTMVFFESPHRLGDALSDAAEVFGADRPACVVRELTKLFEQVAWGTLGELAEQFDEGVKGEIVVVVGGKPREEANIEDAVVQVASLMADGVKRSDACAQIAKETGLTKRELYAVSISTHP